MTYVNVTVDSRADVQIFKECHMRGAEVEFWRARAEDLHRRLENLYDHASATGSVELWRGGDKITLCVENFKS